METQQNSVSNREIKKHELVVNTHKKNKQSGIFETVDQIFQRLPIPRLDKGNYKFIFEGIKDNVESAMAKQNALIKIQEQQQKKIKKIEIKMSKIPSFPSQQQLQLQNLKNQRPLFKALEYLQNQQELKVQVRQGQPQTFLTKSQYIHMDKIQAQIQTIKIFAQQYQSFRKYQTNFINQNTLNFSNKVFPSTNQIQSRAEILAKLYLLNLYKDQSKKMMTMDRNQQNSLQNKRKINIIKHEMDIQKMKQGQIIQDTDLLNQVFKIRDLIQKKMNALAYEEFKSKNGSKATEIKKSLEKIKQAVDSQPVPKIKLKMLIAYKFKKGW